MWLFISSPIIVFLLLAYRVWLILYSRKLSDKQFNRVVILSSPFVGFKPLSKITGLVQKLMENQKDEITT